MSHWAETLFREQADTYAEFFAERFDAAADQVDSLDGLLAAECGVDPDSVLDLACGTGRHVLAFADRGLDAEGVDFSEPFLAEARERAAERGLADEATFRHGDVRELDDWSGSYDLVTNFWNSLGYYDRETDEQVLANARRLLSADGVLAVEFGNKDYYLANFEDASVAHDEDAERLFVERRDYDPETGRFHTTLDLFDTEDGYDHVETMEWVQRMYAPVVLRELCEAAGFDDVSLFGGFDGRDLTLEADTLVVLAQ